MDWYTITTRRKNITHVILNMHDAYNMHSESNLVNFSIQNCNCLQFHKISTKNNQDMLEKKGRKSI
jgi:hypothetical protein